MAKFKCLLSGNIFEFKNDYDIDEMREHPQYEEVEEDDLQEEQNTKKEVKKPRKVKAK